MHLVGIDNAAVLDINDQMVNYVSAKFVFFNSISNSQTAEHCCH